ncbi:ATP-binding protein [Pseudothauera rhizosphaerae]|nr:HAMP domain-containing sensor histidine kinase [Pseudothauera rhizosphaerae]
MAHPVPSALRPAAPSLVPSGSEALLGLLGNPEPDWRAAAELTLRDVTLCFPLLAARPLAGGEACDLGALLEQRLRQAGTGLLRAWMLHLAQADPPRAAAPAAELAQTALLAAECARHIAQENRYPRPDEAYLAGMWLALGQAVGGASGQSANAAAAALATQCGLPSPIVDALLIEQALEEYVAAAHPLARILWSAVRLAREPDSASDPRFAAMAHLAPEVLASLRTDIAFLAGGRAAPPATAGAPWPRGPLPPQLQAAALGGLLQGAFAGLDAEAVHARLALGCRLLAGVEQPLILSPADDRPLALLSPGAPRLAEWVDELALRSDDESSMIALALRSTTPTTVVLGESLDTRSAADWQIGRWLGAGVIACVPLALAHTRTVAVFGCPLEHLPLDAAASTLGILIARAADRLLDEQARVRAQTEQAEQFQARYRQHARTLVHEANNPLTVIRSYVGLLEQRHADDTSLRDKLALIDEELARVGDLLGRFSALPGQDAPEEPHCAVGSLLDELRALCAEPLFESHGIRFELRKPAVLPRVAMPASALRQVLLNLLRNASEALSPGTRFALAVPGQLVVDGRPCLEIRLIDNGPGLSAERMADLFASGSTTKGGEHQGIGLSIVRDILLRWNATVVCRSQAGSGTGFQLFVPVQIPPDRLNAFKNLV